MSQNYSFPFTAITPVAGSATAANQVLEIAQLTAIDGKLGSLGQKAMAGSAPVVIASDQSAVPVSGPLTDAELRATAVPVSAAALPLPSGAATAANQATEIASLASIDTKLTSPLTVTGPLTDAQLRATPVPVSGTVAVTGGATAANQATEIASLASIDGKTPALGQALAAASVPVVLTAAQLTTLTPLTSVAATQLGAWNITNISGTVSLPTGASTSALQTTGNTSLSSIDGKLASLGQKTMSGSEPVVIASDQSAIPVTSGGSAGVANAPQQITYSVGSPVTTAAYTQVIASTTAATNFIEIFDSSGQAMILATGAAASEVILYYVPPGGTRIAVSIPSGTRIAIKALTANATSGYFLINLLK